MGCVVWNASELKLPIHNKNGGVNVNDNYPYEKRAIPHSHNQAIAIKEKESMTWWEKKCNYHLNWEKTCRDLFISINERRNSMLVAKQLPNEMHCNQHLADRALQFSIANNNRMEISFHAHIKTIAIISTTIVYAHRQIGTGKMLKSWPQNIWWLPLMLNCSFSFLFFSSHSPLLLMMPDAPTSDCVLVWRHSKKKSLTITQLQYMKFQLFVLVVVVLMLLLIFCLTHTNIKQTTRGKMEKYIFRWVKNNIHKFSVRSPPSQTNEFHTTATNKNETTRYPFASALYHDHHRIAFELNMPAGRATPQSKAGNVKWNCTIVII